MTAAEATSDHASSSLPRASTSRQSTQISNPRVLHGQHIRVLGTSQQLRTNSVHAQVEDSPVPLLLGTTAASAVPLRVAPRVAALFSSTLPGRGAVQRPYWEPFMRPLLMILAIGVAYWQFGRGRYC